MTKTINFDMDGTIVDFYGVDNWLDDLINDNTRPYDIAKPLINMNVLARMLNKLKKQGYIINIISWLSKNGTNDFNTAVTKSKKQWLKKHLKSVEFDNIFIVPYGTPKHLFAKGILFDDEEQNRIMWGEGAHNVNNIIDVLKRLK